MDQRRQLPQGWWTGRVRHQQSTADHRGRDHLANDFEPDVRMRHNRLRKVPHLRDPMDAGTEDMTHHPSAVRCAVKQRCRSVMNDVQQIVVIAHLSKPSPEGPPRAGNSRVLTFRSPLPGRQIPVAYARRARNKHDPHQQNIR
jgi:hypothetical protein